MRSFVAGLGALGPWIGPIACTFGAAGAGAGAGSSADTGEVDGDTNAATTGPFGATAGPDDAASATASTGDPDGGTGAVTITGTTTDDPPGDSSGDTATSSGGDVPFVLCDRADPDLRACYDFVDAESGTLHDLSSHGNDGTVDAGVDVQPGPFGSVVRVTDDATISVPDSASLDILGPDISFDVWVRLDALPPANERRGIFDKDGEYSLMVFGTDGLRCGIGHTNVLATPILGEWMHVACVGAEDGTAMYIDGVEVQTGESPVDAMVDNFNPLAVGDNSPQFDQPLDGQVAALRVFSRTLGPGEVAEAAAAALE
jgi:hypothetical protein